MRKIIGILMALCLLTVLVSSASASRNSRDCGDRCFDLDIENIESEVADSDVDVELKCATSTSHADGYVYAEGDRCTGSDCPTGFIEVRNGILETGTYASALGRASGYEDSYVDLYGETDITATFEQD